MRASDTVIAALKRAFKRRLIGKASSGLLFHSDRGVQYTCTEFTSLLGKLGMVQSNPRKGNCWDNAAAESFFKTLIGNLTIEEFYKNQLVNNKNDKQKLLTAS